MSRSPRCLRTMAGHTLLEMMLSITLLSLIAATVGSAVMFAASATPDADSVTATLIDDSRLISRIAEDMALARYVIEQGDNAITFVVDDRTGDEIPDRIRYAWGGSTGDPLTYQLNDNNAVELIDSVAEFMLNYTIESAQDQLPVAIYYDDEKQIDGYTDTSSGSTEPVKPTYLQGQIVTPAYTSYAFGFMPTRILMHAESKPPYDGQVQINLRNRSGNIAGNTVFATDTVDETALPALRAWHEFDLSGLTYIDKDTDLGLYAEYVSGSNEVVEIGRDSVGLGDLGIGGGVGGHLYSWNSGSTWNLSTSKTLMYLIFGRELRRDVNQHTDIQQHLTMVSVSLQSSEQGRSPLKRTVRMMLAPQLLEGFAEAGFDSDPTTMDLNADGELDWSHDSGTFPATSLSSGLWVCDGQLICADKSMLTTDVVAVHARMRSNDIYGPRIYGPHTAAGTDDIVPIMTVLRDDGSGGQELVVYNDELMATERLVISGLPAGLVDIGLTWLPAQQVLAIEINHVYVTALLLDAVENRETIPQGVRFDSTGGVAEFGSIEVRVGGQHETENSVSASITHERYGLSFK